MSALTQTLIEYAEELEEATAGSGMTYLGTLRTKGLAAIATGDATTLVNTVVNGQTTTAQVAISSVDLLDSVAAAIRELKGDTVKFTIATFSHLPH